MSLCRLSPSPVPLMPAARDLLVQDLVEPEVVDPAAAVLLRHGHAEEAAAAGLGEDLARADAGPLPVEEVRHDLLLGERAERLAEGEVVVVVVLAVHVRKFYQRSPDTVCPWQMKWSRSSADPGSTHCWTRPTSTSRTRRTARRAGRSPSARSPDGRSRSSRGTAPTTGTRRTSSRTARTCGRCARSARRQVVSLSAVGSLRADRPTGTLVVPDQIVDRTHGRAHTFYDGATGVGHMSFADPYCPRGRAAARWPAASVVDGGTLVVVNGPRFSTRAESLEFQSHGWSIIGMTAMPEAALARELGLCYTTLALVTDLDAGVEAGAGRDARRGARGVRRESAAAARPAGRHAGTAARRAGRLPVRRSRRTAAEVRVRR